MKKIYLIITLVVTGFCGMAQVTAVKTNFGDPQGASLGNRVVFVNTLTGELGSTDGTMGGTVAIPTATVVLAAQNATKLNNKIVFVGMNLATGQELWSSDGTIAGTTIIKDINAGPASSNILGGNEGFTTAGNTMYFTAEDGVNGRELWKTDGTLVGTVMVKDLNAVSISMPMVFGTTIGSTIFFTVNTAANGLELWKSDGTSAGTVMVKDITPGAGSTVFSNMFAGNGTYVYFIANDGSNGAELWRTDGTEAGTMMLEINAGAGSSFDMAGITYNWNFHFFNNDLYFQPNGPAISGSKMYKTNGTPVGTSMLFDFNPGGGGFVNLWDAIDRGDRFFFQANGELYGTNGTAAGTVLIKDINPGAPGSNPRILKPRENLGSEFTPGLFAGGRFFFTANNGTNGEELWVSDGSAAGTIMVKDVFPGASGAMGGGNDTYYYTKYKFFFAADNGTNGFELWETDGTTAGTMMVTDLNAGAGTSNIEFFGVAEANNKLVFRGDNGDGVDIYVLSASVVPFPVTLTEFTGQLKNEQAELKWATQQEVNFSHFNLQRSITGSDFVSIARVAAKGGTAVNNYSYIDNRFTKAGNYYYRLQMVDKDGRTSYSNIVTLQLRPGFSFSLVATRNEAIVGLNDANGIVNIRLMDLNGKVLTQQKQSVTAGEVIKLPISHLASGMYMIVVEYNGAVQTERFIR